MKYTLTACLMLLVSGLCYAEAETPSSFLGESMDSQKARDFYQSRCRTLAVEQGVRADDPQYMKECLSDMAEIWPLGYDESED